MPGRKKKKQAKSSQWPPLQFESSPLYQPAPVLEVEPVAENPVTAKSVNVLDLSDTVWVSPQFNARLYHGSSSRRLTRSLVLKKGSTQVPCATLSTKKANRYRPLCLLNELSVENEGHHDRQNNQTIAVAAFSDDQHVADTNFQKQSTEPQTSFTNNSGKECDRADARSGDPNNDLAPTNTSLSKIKVRRRKSDRISIAKTRQSLHNYPDGLIACNNTNGPLVKEDSRLYLPIDKSNQPTNDVNCSLSNPDPSDNNYPCGESEPFLASSPKTPVLQSLAAVSTNRLLEESTQSNTVTPQRLFKDPAHVLALDTPECDYGLKLRQRQIKYGVQLNNLCFPNIRNL